MNTEFIGGRIKYFVDYWKKLTSDKEILANVTGLRIRFDEVVSPYYRRCLKFSDSEKDTVRQEISKLVKKKVIVPSVHEQGEVISNVFLRQKKDGKKFRMILNLKPLNKSVEYIHFKMDGLETAKCLVRENCFMASIDLSDAYFSVPLHSKDRKLVKFEFDNQLYEFTAMPQGLACAPRVFTKLLKPFYAKMRHLGFSCVGYIDDSLIVGNSSDECATAVRVMIDELQKLGFVINFEKSVMKPVQEIQYLGYVINSVRMSVNLPNDKIEYIQQLCRKFLSMEWVSLRELAQCAGVMTAYSNGMEHGQLHYRSFEKLKVSGLRANRGNFDAKVRLSAACIMDCQWWLNHAGTNEKQILHGNPDITIVTDASRGGTQPGGWGAVRGEIEAGGPWSPWECAFDINVLELLAVFFGLRSLCPHETNVHIQIKSDNTCAIAYINHMGGMHSERSDALARQIWDWAISRHIWLSAVHVPGTENVADEASRIFHDNTEWKLNEEVFQSIVDIWGSPDVDMFASRLNAQLDRYVSWGPDPDAEAIDAFSLNWHDEFMFLNPPFSLLPRVIQKLEMDKGRAILIAPIWKTQAWFAGLTNLLIDNPLKLPRMHRLFYLPYAPEKIHPIRPQMMACLVSGDHSDHKAFLQKLSKSCSSRGEAVRRNNIARTYPDGNAIVLPGISIEFNRL